MAAICLKRLSLIRSKVGRAGRYSRIQLEPAVYILGNIREDPTAINHFIKKNLRSRKSSGLKFVEIYTA